MQPSLCAQGTCGLGQCGEPVGCWYPAAQLEESDVKMGVTQGSVPSPDWGVEAQAPHDEQERVRERTEAKAAVCAKPAVGAFRDGSCRRDACV